VSEALKGDHPKSRGQPPRRHFVSTWWRCEPKELGEDLVLQLNGGSESSEHLVWGYRSPGFLI